MLSIYSNVSLSCGTSRSNNYDEITWRKLSTNQVNLFKLYFKFLILFSFNANLNKKKLRSNQGKLELKSLRVEDSGEYECALSDERRYKYKISVLDLPSIQLFETRSSLRTPNELVAQLNKNTEQACSSVTTSNFLKIEWYNQNGNVIYLCLFEL